jgi:hypothetical protein
VLVVEDALDAAAVLVVNAALDSMELVVNAALDSTDLVMTLVVTTLVVNATLGTTEVAGARKTVLVSVSVSVTISTHGSNLLPSRFSLHPNSGAPFTVSTAHSEARLQVYCP